jgi:hypothetical protein
MNKSLHRQEFHVRQPGTIFTGLKILHLLVDLTRQLTEEEQRDAGIYLGSQYGGEDLSGSAMAQYSYIQTTDKEKYND